MVREGRKDTTAAMFAVPEQDLVEVMIERIETCPECHRPAWHKKIGEKEHAFIHSVERVTVGKKTFEYKDWCYAKEK